MKLGNSPSPKSDRSSKKHSDSDGSSGEHANPGSWRQAIFNRVALDEFDNKEINNDGILNDLYSFFGVKVAYYDLGLVVTAQELLRRPPSFSNLNQAHPKRRTKEEIRELWKKSINQAILLIRMEKENARLRGTLQSIRNSRRILIVWLQLVKKSLP
jgi:hypothetical protein